MGYHVLKPDHHLYTVLSNLVLMKPVINTKELPVFLSMFNSYHMEHAAEQTWLLKLLADSLRDVSDYYLYKRSHVCELVMSFYNSPVCNPTMKQHIVKILHAACRITTAAFDLVKTHSVLLWVHGNMCTEKCDEVTSSLYSLVDRVVRTFSGVEGEQAIPKLLSSELSIICTHGLKSMVGMGERELLCVLSVFNYLQSSAGYLGSSNIVFDRCDLVRCFNCTLGLLNKKNKSNDNSNENTSNNNRGDSGRDKDILWRVLHTCVTLLKEGSEDVVDELDMEGLVALMGSGNDTEEVATLVDDLLTWCKTVNNAEMLQKLSRVHLLREINF